MIELCDHKAVGVIIHNPEGDVALLRRTQFPLGMTPPTGHVDDHGGLRQAAVDEVREESGLIVCPEDLVETEISNWLITAKCRRLNGNHHYWTVYKTAEFKGSLTPNITETEDGDWYDRVALQSLANITHNYMERRISKTEWQKNPGLETTWLRSLVVLGYVK